MGSKGSQQKTEQTSTATSAPNAQAGALYGDILNQLQGYVQQNPNAPVYQGERVAQFTPDQLAAMGTVNQAQGAYQPYMQQAGQFAQQAGSAITPGQINAAMNPYQQQVIDATMAQMGQKNAQQMSALKGTEAQQGAFGGSRAAVTEANLGGQQNMNMASTLAGLNNQNYTQAVAQAQANRAAAGTGAQLESGLGTQSMQLPFMGAQAQLQTGAQQQQLAQQNLNVPYQNFLQQQAWTPQMLQFEAGLGTGVGSQMGGTSTNTGTTTTTPAQPNPWTQIAGGALAVGLAPFTGGASLAALPAIAAKSASGGRINKADGGSVGSDIVGNAVRMARQMREGMAGGGVPGAGVGTSEYMGHSIPAIIPTSQMAMGKGAPSTPGFVSSPEMKNPNADMKGMGSSLGTLAKAGYDKWNEPMDISTLAQGAYTPMAVGDISSGTIGGTGLSGFGGLFSLGGTVSPESAYHGFAHRAYGGFDPTPISQQGGEDPNKAPVMPPEGFTDQPLSIVPAGEFKPYEAPPQADVPMPRPRPESLRVDDLAAAAPMPIGVDGVAPPTGGIFTRLLRAESNGRQVDENGNPLTSPKGATGIAQIMPTTGPEAAKLAKLPWDKQKFKYDANYNATLGKAYFDHQTKVFGGDPEKGAAAYNAGPGKLQEALAMAAANGGSYKDYLPAETQNYLGKIFGQPQAGLGPRGDEDGQAMAFNRESSIAGSQGISAINQALKAQSSDGSSLALPLTQSDGGDRIIGPLAAEAVKGATTPTQLAQNASILERLTGIQLSDAGRQALMAAGLRMMTTPGNIGTVLGTAGMQGMTTYSEAKQLEQAQIEAQRKQAFEQKKFGSTEQHQRAQEQQAKDTLAETQRHRQFLEMQPVKIGVDKNYNEVWAIKDPKTGKFIPIDPATGTPRTDNPDVLPKTEVGLPVPPEDISLPKNARPIEFNVGTLDDRPLGDYHPEVLENETPEMANAVKAIAEGRRAMPTRALDKGYNRKVMELVGLYNPQYDQSVFPSRQRTANEFKVGMAARNLTATKTLAGHLEALYESAKKLDNSGFPAWNALQQKMGSQTTVYGKEYQDAIADYNVKRKAVADEAAKVFAGSTSALADRESWEKKFDVSDPLNVQAQSIRSTVDLIDSRLIALADQYNRGMSTGHQPHELIEKKYKDIFDRMRHANPEKEKSTKTEASGKPAAPPAAGQGAAPTKVVPPTQADRDYVKNHPETRNMFIERFGVEP